MASSGSQKKRVSSRLHNDSSKDGPGSVVASASKKKKRATVIVEVSSDDEEDIMRRLRRSLNEVHWHNGRIRFFQNELEDHVRSAERAACAAEEAYEDLLTIFETQTPPSPSLTTRTISPTSTHFSTALSRTGSDDSLEFEDPETEELIRSIELAPDGTPIKEEPSTPPKFHQPPTLSNSNIVNSPSIKRSMPMRSPSTLGSPASVKRPRKGPKGGFIVLNGKEGINGVFATWAMAASVGQNVSGAIIQGFNSFSEAQIAYDACSASGLLAYLTLPEHEKQWFAVVRGSKPGVCQKSMLLDFVGLENLEHVQVSDILVAPSEKEATKLFREFTHNV
ncbi:hypothetical protein VNI00_016762 [Paramarasmius palmivorus]|uniref:Uncharacterized protein n=1 Tax=Paramarasmius palmivorus TaxID=297713 RepID=A0AAW0BCW2_9AGAR